jgi:hypothetical protein
MVRLRKRAKALYPMLNADGSEMAKKTVKRLDRALNACLGVLDRGDPRARELAFVCSLAESILE